MTTKQSIVIYDVPYYMFRHLQGRQEGGCLQKNTRTVNRVEDGQVWSRNTSSQIQYCKFKLLKISKLQTNNKSSAFLNNNLLYFTLLYFSLLTNIPINYRHLHSNRVI